MSRYVVVIHPREGVSVQEIAGFLMAKFQQPGQCDGNPLINAHIAFTDGEPIFGPEPSHD